MSGASTSPPPLVRIARKKLDRTAWYGFVVGESERLVVIHAVSESYGLDGYRAFRREDVSSMDTEFARADLVRRALRLKRLAPVLPRSLDLHDMRSLMGSAQAAYPLLVIHRERVEPDACEVGRIHMSTNRTYILRWINPNAEWESDDRPFLYRDVTLVEFDDDYGNTLAMVAEDRAREAAAALVTIVEYTRQPPVFEPWDPVFPEVASALVSAIRRVAADIEVEHVGSTAVPGCGGKGVLDLVLLHAPGALDCARAALDALGFQRQTGPAPFPESRPMRVATVVWGGRSFRAHAHVVEAGCDEHRELIRFRDRLRRDEQLRAAYEAEKRAILARGVQEGSAYAEAKTAFIRAALEGVDDA